MNRVISITLIFVMSIQCFYKLGVIGYFQLNQDYIAEVLCINKDKPIAMCNGQCFLKQKLNLGEEEKNTSIPLNRERSEIISFLVSQYLYLPCANSFETPDMNSSYSNIYVYEYSTVAFHPPCIG